MIKFNFLEKKDVLTFEDVEEDQFFINQIGELCQKTDVDSYSVVADENGRPYSWNRKCCPEENISKIFPFVTKIEF
jgi:hypothetical protein